MTEMRYSAFFSGLSVGVGLAMLFAPRAGRATRDRIADKAAEGKQFVRRRGAALRESAAGLIEHGKEAFTRNKEEMQAALHRAEPAAQHTHQESPYPLS